MNRETKYKETVQEFEEKLGRELRVEEKKLLREVFNLENPSNN